MKVRWKQVWLECWEYRTWTSIRGNGKAVPSYNVSDAGDYVEKQHDYSAVKSEWFLFEFWSISFFLVKFKTNNPIYALQIYFLIDPSIISYPAVKQHTKHKGPPPAFVFATCTHLNSTYGSKIHLHTHMSPWLRSLNLHHTDNENRCDFNHTLENWKCLFTCSLLNDTVSISD